MSVFCGWNCTVRSSGLLVPPLSLERKVICSPRMKAPKASGIYPSLCFWLFWVNKRPTRENIVVNTCEMLTLQHEYMDWQSIFTEENQFTIHNLPKFPKILVFSASHQWKINIFSSLFIYSLGLESGRRKEQRGREQIAHRWTDGNLYVRIIARKTYDND